MIYRTLDFLIAFTIFIVQYSCSTETYWNETYDTTPQTITVIPDHDIYKCVSYTTAHIDTSHSIHQDFSIFKNCRTSGLYTLNRFDRQFKIDIDVQRSWIVDTSAIIFNGTIKPICGLNSDNFVLRPTESCEDNGINITITETDRFETLCLFHEMGNLIFIITHHKNGEPLHFNINIWQTQTDVTSSYGLCSGVTCNSDPEQILRHDRARSDYPTNVIVLICDIYIDNYLSTTGREPWQRSVHYNRTILNARQACIADVQRENWPHSAAGSVEVLFVEEQVNSDEIRRMSDIAINFQNRLENKLVKLAETIDLSRIEVDDMLAKITTTTIGTTIVTDTEKTTQFTYTTDTVYSTINYTSQLTTSSSNSTTDKPNNKSLAIIIGCSVGGGGLLIGLLIVVYCCVKKTKVANQNRKIVSNNEIHMNERQSDHF